MTSTPTPTTATHEQITRRAFAIWCENGRQPDSADENWRAAERELERAREHGILSALQDVQDAKECASGPARRE